MPTTISDAILHALAPGIALNSAIFYNSSLQNRFLYITARARDLNREARDLAKAEGDVTVRLASIRTQVDAMTKRARAVRRAVVIVYCALSSFILTILALLLQAVTRVPGGELAALLLFAAGFVALATATLVSMGEMALSQRTLDEDIRSSY
ncbi:MAG: hypothetical protein JWM80_803 [Cyanobacteria bacterium RYN_339]|nr:hypothetical protein [Cyanobacteria bacterium RYN_339]